MNEPGHADLVAALHGNPVLQFVVNSFPGSVAYIDRDLRYRFVNDVYDVLLPRIGARAGRDEISPRSVKGSAS